MSMKDLECAYKLIEKYKDKVDFHGVKDEAIIKKAETMLDISFPPTYRRFLKDHGCGSFGAEEFYGIASDNFENARIPNGIWLTLKRRQSSNLACQLVLIADEGLGGYYAIDTSKQDKDGESIIVVWYGGLSEPRDSLEEVAPDFGKFFYDRILSQVKRLNERF